MATLETTWQRDLHQRPVSRSVLRHNLIVVPERECHLVRLSADAGEVVWDVRVRSTWGWPCVDEHRFYWLNQHHEIQCVDLAGGTELWKVSLDGIYGFLVEHRGVLLTGGWRGYTDLVALEAATGRQVWSLPLQGEERFHPIPTDDGFIIPSRTEVALVSALGQLVNAVEAPPGLPEVDSTPNITSWRGSLLAAAADGQVSILEPQSVHWRELFNHTVGIETSRLMVADERIVFVDRESQLQVYDTQGNPRWSVPWSHNRRDLLPAAFIDHGDLVVGSSFGRLSVFSASGQELVRCRPGKRIDTDIACIAPNQIVFGAGGTLRSATLLRNS